MVTAGAAAVVCTYVIACPCVDLQAVAEGRARLYDNASQNCRSVHAIPVVGLQGARPGRHQASPGERRERCV
jgi:hypothetical protein